MAVYLIISALPLMRNFEALPAYRHSPITTAGGLENRQGGSRNMFFPVIRETYELSEPVRRGPSLGAMRVIVATQ